MKSSRLATPSASFIRLAVSAAIVGAALCTAVPAQADPASDDFLKDLASSGAGLGGIDPSTAADMGGSICPMLSEPGQQMADAASNVSGAIGKPMGPAPMFTGVAISLLCPMAMNSMANGQNPIPFGLFGG